jgi:uncharacterized protein GlcG (DUF336 family)
MAMRRRLACPAHAELLTEKNLSTQIAVTIARTAYETCALQGYHVSVHVVGREGQPLVAIRGDGSSPHTLANSLRKVFTARTFRSPSGEFAQRVKDNPTTGAVFSLMSSRPRARCRSRIGDDVIGAVGVFRRARRRQGRGLFQGRRAFTPLSVDRSAGKRAAHVEKRTCNV